MKVKKTSPSLGNMVFHLFPRRMDLYVLGLGGYSVVFNLVTHGNHQHASFIRTAGGNVRWLQIFLWLAALISALRTWFLRYTSDIAQTDTWNPLGVQKLEARRQRRRLSKADSRFRRKHDQSDRHPDPAIRFPLIQRVPYAHGGFFGAAPFMLNDPKWTAILRTLIPQVYIHISRKAARAASPHKLILWAENNPVVAAYGTINELHKTGRLPNIEWDVFLDPSLVDRLEGLLDARTCFCEDQGLSVLSVPIDDSSLSYDQRTALASYDAEITAQTTNLVNKMMIAHGSLSQLLLEQTGFAKAYNFASIRNTSPTLGGGFAARTWLQCFAEALLLGMDHDPVPPTVAHTAASSKPDEAINKPKKKIFRPTYWAELLSRATNSKTRSKRIAPTELQDKPNEKFATEQTPAKQSITPCSIPFPSTAITMAQSLAIIRQVTGCHSPLGIVFDLKSRHVPPRIWARVIDTIRQAGLRVEGMGSFNSPEVANLSRFTRAPVREVVFFHSAGDLQKACDTNQVWTGASVFFNAGSLIWEPQTFRQALCSGCYPFDSSKCQHDYKLLSFAASENMDDNDDSQNSRSTASTIKDYKEAYQLSIGLYCQEFAIDDVALNLIVEYVNRNQHIIDLGLSWGGFNGTTTSGIQPSWWEPSDGMWTQRYAGTAWDPDRCPPNLKRKGQGTKM